MKQFIKEHHISLSSLAKHEDTSPRYMEKGLALITIHAPRDVGWIIDSRASVHITHLDDTMIPGSLQEPLHDRPLTTNDQFVHVVGVCDGFLGIGLVSNAHLILDITYNLLPLYHIKQQGKTIEFILDSMLIHHPTMDIFAVSRADNQSKVFTFDCFIDDDDPYVPLTHLVRVVMGL